MARRQQVDYFKGFVDLVEYCCSASRNLVKTFINFEARKLPETMEYLHNEIEHKGDLAKHELMFQLAHEFIAPIEREDIIDLAQGIDDVTDSIEDVVMRLYMFNISSIREEALPFANVIVKCCDCLKKAMIEFRNFHKSTTIHGILVEINHLEEEGDQLYTQALRNLYVNCKDPVEIMAWTETFDHLEKCCDACEDVAEIVESVIMKNT